MKTFHFKAITVVAALFLVGTSISFAQHDHGSQGQSQKETSTMKAPESPHGGMLKTAGKYQIELVVNMMQKEDKITVYLLTKSGKTLSTQDVTGTIMFMYKDGTDVTETLVAKGDNRFVAQLKTMDSFSAMVSLKVKGKTIGANFQHEGMHGHGDMGMYKCPMHPEITSSESGTCSKCGMTLKKA
jgi:heavy metal-binding protein